MKKSLKWIGALGGAAIMVLLLRSLAITSCLIPSEGMENSLFRGERIVVNKWSYGLRVPCEWLFAHQRWHTQRVQKGEVVLFNNPADITQPVIDQRGVFISRCVGVPGDTLLIDSLFSIVSPNWQANPDRKRVYRYPRHKEQQMDSLLTLLSLWSSPLRGESDDNHLRSFSHYEYYLLQQAMNGDGWIELVDTPAEQAPKPLIIPSKGKAIRVYPWNRTLLRNTLVMHEGKQAEIKNDTLYVDNRPTQHCYFTKDYYWMASNNSVNLSDSRLFGLVPQDHLIGKASFIWFSKENNTSPLSGYRWNRFFQTIK